MLKPYRFFYIRLGKKYYVAACISIPLYLIHNKAYFVFLSEKCLLQIAEYHMFGKQKQTDGGPSSCNKLNGVPVIGL